VSIDVPMLPSRRSRQGAVGGDCAGFRHAIQRSAWKGDSANFAFIGFSKVRLTVARLSEMEAQLLPDGRTKLLLSRREIDLIGSSLLNALYRGARKGRDSLARFRELVGITYVEGQSLDDELWIIHTELFGPPQFQSERDRKLYEQHKPVSPERTGTAWDDMPKIEAEPLPDSRASYTMARGGLSIFAGAIDMMLENLAWRRDGPGRAEVSIVMGVEIEDLEALRDELRALDRDTRGATSG
jgi:hypothetical protein